MAAETRPKPLFKVGDAVFTTLSHKELKIANYRFGTIMKVRWHGYNYRYFVCFQPARIRVLVPIWQANVWLNEGALILKKEYPRYRLQQKILNHEVIIERLQIRIHGEAAQIQEVRKKVENLKNKLLKLENK